MKLQTVPTDNQGNSLNDRMNGVLKGRQPGQQVVHSPTGWISVFDSGAKNNEFSWEEWQVWFWHTTGANNPQISESWRKNKKTCRGCDQVLDRKGHHLQCCNSQHKGTWQAVHEDLNDAWISLAKAGGLKDTKKRANDLPRPDNDKSNMHADVYFNYHSA